jgi:hypothetical protein
MRKLPRLFKKQVITPEQWEEVRSQSEAAKEILEDPRFTFLRDYLANMQSSVVDHFVNNKIRHVQEHVKLSDSLTRVLTTTKEEQEEELSGRYKLVDELLADLRHIANLADEYRKAQEEGKIVIEDNKEKDE